MLSIQEFSTVFHLRLLHTQEVRGSSPCAPTNPSTTYGSHSAHEHLPEHVIRSRSESQMSPRSDSALLITSEKQGDGGGSARHKIQRFASSANAPECAIFGATGQSYRQSRLADASLRRAA